ncbi:hypothetical protein HY256_02670, partial [Candidatus Sumerlaeota bacterium]|nr:hypothetical protein [Candidatus Sumerlaeota bacterium]
GWNRAPSGLIESGFTVQSGLGSVRAAAEMFQSDRAAPLLVVDLGGTKLAGHDELFPRFLDLPLETRMILGAARVLSNAGHLLLLSAGRMELYRLPDEVREYNVLSGRGFEEELLPALLAKARGKSDGLGVLTGYLEDAESLRGWIKHWSRQIAAQIEIGLSDCEVFLWKLVLMLQMRRKTAKSELLGGWGLGCEKLGDIWSLTYDSINTHSDLAAVLDDFEKNFSSRIFSGDAEMHKQWLGALEETSLAEQLRAELLMRSQAKFQAESVAWLYTSMEREQEGWKREMAGLPPVRKRFHSQGWLVIKPLECDIARYGLEAALRDLDRLAGHWSEYDIYMRREQSARGDETFTQPDLFLDAPRGVDRANLLEDPINFIFGHSLRLIGVEREQEFGVGLVFLLKALNLVQKHDWPFRGVDTLDKLWQSD